MSTETVIAREAKDQTARSDVLVDSAWLADHLFDPGVCVVEVDVSPAAYTAGHIEGAVLWNIYSDLKDPEYRLVDTAAVEKLVSRSGISAESIVVFYGYGPALGFWLMKLHGHSDVRLLDASRESWLADRLPWTDEPGNPVATDYPLPDRDDRIRATQVSVERAIADPASIILDVRTAAEFDGERFWPSGGLEEHGRAGHVPGATHLVADEVRDASGAFLAEDQLVELFSPIGLDAGKEIITYCTIGGRAATAWFVLDYLLGQDKVRMYDGSWAEWGRQPDTAVATSS